MSWLLAHQGVGLVGCVTPWRFESFLRHQYLMELLHRVRSNRELRDSARRGRAGSSDGEGHHRKVSRAHVEMCGRPEGRSRFSDARRVPSCVLVRHVSRCSFAGLRLRPRDGCWRPAGRTPGRHLERPSRDGFGRQVFGESATTGFRVGIVTEMAVGAPGCGLRGYRGGGGSKGAGR